MPNGNPEIGLAEWKKIAAFFDQISGTLSDFASRHNLAVDQYYHGSPSWSFRFQHPKGGSAAVCLERLNESKVRLNGFWYVDEYETLNRRLKFGTNRDLLLEDINLRNELEACLTELVGWENRDLTPHAASTWSAYSKEEWSRMSENLPRLRP